MMLGVLVPCHTFSVYFFLSCCFASTETVRTFTLGQGAQDVHLDFHTAPELCSWSVFQSNIVLRPRRPYGTIRDGEPRASTSTFTQLLRSRSSLVQCCFTSTETVRNIKDGELRTSTSTFPQLLRSVLGPRSMLIYVHRDPRESRTSTSTFPQLLSCRSKSK